MLSSIYYVCALFVVPVLVVRVCKPALSPARAFSAFFVNALAVAIAVLPGYFFVHDIQQHIEARSLGIDLNGFWPADLTPEQEAFLQRLIWDTWKLGMFVLSRGVVMVHMVVFGLVLLFLTRTRSER